MNSLEAGAGGCVEKSKFVIALCTLRRVSDTQIALESAPGHFATVAFPPFPSLTIAF